MLLKEEQNTMLVSYKHNTRHLRVNRCDASKTALYLCLYLCYIRIIQV